MRVQHFFAVLFFSCMAYAAQHIIVGSLAEENIYGAVQEVVSKQQHVNSAVATKAQHANKANEVPSESPISDAPTGPAHTPNSIKHIKMANPAEAVTIIEAPAVNSNGSANVIFPIKLPTGRNGLEPDLAVRYNSEAANGWLGFGWNLDMDAITIETRWGVPRYSAAMETETYSFNGAQLSPVAHRANPIARTAEKQFYPRVEGSFDKMIRHGSTPANYWWEVTDKSGTRQLYGGTGSGVDQDAVLTDANGNIAYWALTETRDPHGNFIKYRYAKVQNAGNNGGSLGSDIYLASITYTGYGSTEGKYRVEFTRDRQLGEAQRPDVSISARLGFKQVTADLLRKVSVQYNGQNIRSYELNYTTGAFYKTLLQSISEFDAAGNLFNTHGLEYYNDVQGSGTFRPLQSSAEWVPQNDNIKAGFVNPIPLFHDKASVLSGNKSFGGGFGMAITIGPFDGNLAMKTNTAGVTFGFNYTKNEGMLALVDINGDGLADKVYKKNGQLSFRPNQSGPDGSTVFGNERPVIGINEFSRGESFAGDIGLESNFVVYAGFEYTRTEDITSVYFSDVNGDQLIDIVRDGKVYFNHIDGNGNPNFTLSSGDTPSPINAAGSIDPNLVENNPQDLEKAIDDNPLHDVVKVWRAPFAGTININAPVNLAMDTSAEAQAYTAADGVRVAIQHKGNELWFADIPANDFTPKSPTGVNAIAVQKGDKIYFRVQSKFNGAYDQVQWAPEITYANQTPALKDANALPLYQFKSDKDFLISADGSTGMTIGGQIKVTGNFSMPAVTDDVTIKIQKKSGGVFSTLLQQSFTAGQAVDFPVDVTENVVKGDALYFHATAATNIDWTKLQWNPFVYFVTTTDTAITRLFDDSGRALVYAHPPVYFKSYNRTIHPSVFWEAPFADTFTIRPTPAFGFPNFENGNLVFSIKKENQLIAKQTIAVSHNFLGIPIVGPVSTSTIILNAGDKLYFEYHTDNPKLADKIQGAAVRIDTNSINLANPTGGLHTLDESFIFGPMYRHWGQFAYNGNRTRAANPIVESELKLDDALMDQNPPSIDLSGDTTADQMQNTYDGAGGNKPKEDKFIYLVPDNQKKLLLGYDNLTYVKKDTLSASRMGKDNLLPVNPIASPNPGAGAGAVGINKVANTDNFSLAAGLVLVGSASFGYTNFLYDFTDMNGDRYPDVLSSSKVQYTQPYGGLEPTAKNFSFGDVSKTEHFSAGLTLGGTFLRSNAANAKATSKGSKAAKAGSQSEASIGISGSINYNKDSTAFAWLDMNGDDLPDRVYKNGNVELNLGYSFLPAEYWGFAGLNEGSALSYGAGLGINISYGSISAGFGLTRSENETSKTLQDMNGDGLLDYVSSGNPLQVAINKGNGFAPAVDWTGANTILKGISTGESINGAFTIGIPIIPILPVVKLCINPSFNIAQGADRTSIDFDDINGDGYPDFLQSDQDNQLSVSLSTIGRTNKLKKVNRPLKGSFTLDYKRIGNTYLMPNSVWALASVELYDGVPGDGADRMLNTFHYENGRYDRHEREFYGFEKVTTFHHDTQNGDIVYRKIEETYSNDNFYEKGLLKAEVLRDAAGNKFTETVNTYELKDILTGVALPNSFKQTDDGAAFPAMVQSEDLFYEGMPTAGKTTSKTYTYDVRGNMVATTDFGDPGTADDVTTQFSYHTLNSKYIMNVPASVTVSGNGQVYRQSATTIDNNTGDITETRHFLQSGEVSKQNVAYDSYGNVVKLTNPPNATGQRLSYDYEYDGEVQTYKTKTTDSYGYSNSATYDVRFAQMLSYIDENGQPTRYTIDNVGRVLTMAGPLEITAGLPFKVAYEYHPEGAVPWAATRHYDPGNPTNYIETATFCDGLRRTVQSKKDGAIFTGAQSPDQEVMLVSGKVEYDALGRTIAAYHPTTEAKGTIGTMSPLADNIAPTRITFDVMDRVLKHTYPDLRVTTKEYGFGNDRNGATQFKTKMVDANGIWREKYTNVRELLKATKAQYSQGSDVWTSYDYNAVNELTGVTDDQDNKILYTFDRLGRRASVKHPDAGLTSYQYDLNGNPTQVITANLQGGSGIKYTYDFERLVRITYPQNLQNNVTLTYGAPGAAFNRAGEVIKQQDATGTQEFFYNPLGEMVKNIRVINVPDAVALTYTTEWTYDNWNRVTGIVYPDGEKLTYTYNVGGLLKQMFGIKGGTTYNYLTQSGYDKFEAKVYMRYGNGTEMAYEYEPETRHLHNLAAKTAAGRLMMDNHYSYDDEDNILGIENNAPIPPSNLMGGKSNYQYSYDDLYRLTEAKGKFNGSNHEHRFNLKMRYDNLFNILSKQQVHERRGYGDTAWAPRNQTSYSYTYNFNPAEKPHAPVHIGDRRFTYDANGNQTGWKHDVSAQNRQMAWDEENRVKTLSDNGEQFRYTYDASGRRVLKSNGNGQRVSVNGKPAAQSAGLGNYKIYVNPYMDVRGGGFTKHFYIEGERIVSKLGESGNGNGNGNGNGSGNGNGGGGNGNGANSEAFQFYYHSDHLGNTAFVTNRLGEVYQHLEYFPFGETFIAEHSNQERTPYLYNGKELDEETGLYYYGARYYDTKTSIWQNTDPLWEMPAEINKSPYAYVINNPLIYTDPTGMKKHKKKAPVSDSESDSESEEQEEGYYSSKGHWVSGKKRGPKTDPDEGQNKTIFAVKEYLEGEGYEHLQGGDLQEVAIKMPKGSGKPIRRPDLVMQHPKTGKKKYIQVGRITKRDELPVMREVEALDDLQGVGIGGEELVFVPYAVQSGQAGGEEIDFNAKLFKRWEKRSRDYNSGKQKNWGVKKRKRSSTN